MMVGMENHVLTSPFFRRGLLRAVLSALCVAAALGGLGCKSHGAPVASSQARDSLASVHTLRVKRLDGTETSLSAWAGKVLLVVNTASECGFTPQYEGLQALFAKYEPRGFAVLGFPSNDFGGQEPGSREEIATFCKTRFGVTFPMFDKVTTIGAGRNPLYALLSEAKGEPKWNFHKYLLDKKGRPVAAWPSSVKPDAEEVARAIETELAER